MIPEHTYEHAIRHFFRPIEGLLADPSVSEVMINGHASIYVERKGLVERAAASFGSEEALRAALRLLSQYVGRPFDHEHPILEARMPDGSRVEAVLGELTKGGTHVAIRKFTVHKLTLSELVARGALTEQLATQLRDGVVSKRNILVSGGTGSGKTSFLNMLAECIPRGERVVILEDARELNPRDSHCVQLEARPGDARGRGAVSIRALLHATLRLRPDRIVVGEIRDGAALDLVQAMTSGHGGCLSTLHASTPRDALQRLETMALMAGVELPLLALRAQVASAIDYIVQLARLRSGQRVVTHLAEVEGLDGEGRYVVRERFRRVEAAEASEHLEVVEQNETTCVNKRGGFAKRASLGGAP